MKLNIFGFLIIFCMLSPSVMEAHEIGGRKKHTMMQELIRERGEYKKCLEKAQKADNKSDVEKQCRKKYALQRKFSVNELYHLYMEHILVATELYSDLLISVHGKVHKVGTSALGFPEIVFALDAFGVTGVRCEFPTSAKKRLAQLEVGAEVTLAGISKGLFNDDYVSLTHCEFLDD